MFRVLAATGGGERTFKAALAAADLGCVALLLWALRRRGAPAAHALWYAWNPLAVVEIAGSGHCEPLALVPLVAAVAWVGPHRARGWAAWAASTAAKYAALVTVPAFSVHADRSEILGWLRGAPRPPETTFVVHGEGPAATALHDAIERELGWTAAVPRYLEQVRLD